MGRYTLSPRQPRYTTIVSNSVCEMEGCFCSVVLCKLILLVITTDICDITETWWYKFKTEKEKMIEKKQEMEED